MKCVFQVQSSSQDVKFRWQKSSGNYLAITSASNVVTIYDRHGRRKSEASIVLPGDCTSMDWDKDGDLLAITHDKDGILFLWSSSTFEVTQLDTGLKDTLSLCCWAKHSQLLAVGTSKGNLLLYNHRKGRKIPIAGKHSKKITCAAWSAENLLALGSVDRTFTISNAEGDTLRQTTLRAEPYNIAFSCTKSERKTSEETAVSIVIGHKTLFLYDMDNAENPIELAFQPHYGDIVAYTWYEDGFIMLGFSNGFLVIISTNKDEIGQELFQSKNHRNYLGDVGLSPLLGQAATCGDHSLKIHELTDLKEVYNIIDVDEDKGELRKLQWTEDGQLLTVGTSKGHVLTFLVKLPMLGEASGTRLAYLSSLKEVTVVNNVEEEPAVTHEVALEPAFVALGPFNFAVGMNDRVWIYDNEGRVSERTYLGSVTSLHLNALHLAVLTDGKIQLQMIDPSSNESQTFGDMDNMESHSQKESRTFPDEGRDDVISCLGLTNDFLVFATTTGSLQFFYLEDWQYVDDFKHIVAITKLFPDNGGTQVVFIDEKSDGFLYNPVTNVAMEIPSFPPNVVGVLWDNWPLDKHSIFAAFTDTNISTYVFYRDTIKGPECVLAGVTKLPFGHKPIMFYNGEISCLTLTGKLQVIRLQTHSYQDDQDLSEPELKSSLEKCILLNRLKDAWTFASALDKMEGWKQLATAALQHLDIEMAICTYQQLKDVAMVYSLQQIQHIEDRNLLAGYIAMFLENYSVAQDLFLASSNSKAALEMSRDLLQWDQALNLAKTLAPEEIPYISKEYAQQLEFTGDYSNAALYYEKGVINANASKNMIHNEACQSGLARMLIRTGDIRRGMNIAVGLNNKQLFKDCAAILEGMKLYVEAATFYEKAQSWDKAVTVYLKTKNWNKVGDLLGKVTSPKLHVQYAKAREAEGQFLLAAKAYEAAKDYDNAVRMYLDHLESPDEAVRVVQEGKSSEGAKMVAKFFQKLGDFVTALQFLVLSKCNDEAYSIAETYGQMDHYAEVIGANATEEDYLKIAAHFEKNENHFKAGVFYFKASQNAKALQHLLMSPSTLHPDGENIDVAIEVVGKAKLETLTQQLTDYLMGEADGIPKDAKYLFRLYMALGEYREAARTAILIAREDQTAGNYRNAHDVLYHMHAELQQHKIRIPAEMNQNLMLLHSYILVKLLVKREEHTKGARMLIRVANNISKFPSHVVPILTSTVIECHRSGLKNSAFNFAAMLMRPEYRANVDPKWKKKIEQIVRKPDKSEVEEPLEPCPYCSQLVQQTKLDCPQCKNNIPYCIITGFHMLKNDWSQCPSCHFPALYSEFKKYLEAAAPEERVCPMCANSINIDDVKQLTCPGPPTDTEP